MPSSIVYLTLLTQIRYLSARITYFEWICTSTRKYTHLHTDTLKHQHKKSTVLRIPESVQMAVFCRQEMMLKHWTTDPMRWSRLAYVTYSDKRGTKSLGNHEITGESITFGSFYQFIAFGFFTLKAVYSYCSHSAFRPINGFKQHISNSKKPTLTKAVSILSARFSYRNGHSTTSLLSRAITSLWCYAQFWHLCQLKAPWSIFGINNSTITKLTLCYHFIRALFVSLLNV